MQKFSDDPLEVHEGCGGLLERLISPPAFQFKGSGWYVTDYARKGGGNGSKHGKPAEAKTESKTESKSESKPESKPAPAANK
jgi:predicted nucleic acid-binding Zn ribbon protein